MENYEKKNNSTLKLHAMIFLRPVGGVNHPDSDLAEVGKLSAKMHLAKYKVVFLPTLENLKKEVRGGFSTFIGQNEGKTRAFPQRLTKCEL